MTNRLMFGVVCLAIVIGLARPLPAPSAEPPSTELFARKNLVAWCIVPFDSKKRGPEERAAMLEKLGFSKFAYDYRAEHIPTFDAEIEALKRHKVELTAWWFPTSLNDEAKLTLAVFAKHKVTPQLWVTGGGGPTKDEADQRARVIAEAGRIRPIAEAAAKVGCKVALYNHGGWFGEPENQIAIIQELKLNNVGIVYNQHHGHDHIDRFPELLQKMKPHLLCLNLNGMTKEGDRKGQKIMQLGEGDLDLKLLKVVRDSGYTGPIGILGHTQDDAEERLHDNLDGLDWLLPQLKDQPAGQKPKMRTPVPKAVTAVVAPPARPNGPALVEGKFGKALDGRSGGALVKGRDEFRQFPLTVECWTKLDNKSQYNILVAHEQKSSGTHWELFSMPGGAFTVYLPGFAPDHCRSDVLLCDDKWHHVAMVLESERIRLFVDAKPVADQKHKRTEMKSIPGELGLATLIDRGIGCSGLVDEVRISKGVRVPSTLPDKPFTPDDTTVALWHLDELVEQKRLDDATSNKNAALLGDASVRRGSPDPAATADRRSPNSTGGKIDGHWGTDAVGFNWTEADSRDDRFGQMDVGPFLSTSLGPPLAPAAWHDPVYKAIVVRVGSKRQASISYDTELLRASAGWTGFVRFDPARFGIIGAPRPDGPITFVTPSLPGWTTTGEFPNFRADHRYGPLPKEAAHYEGLYRHGQRVVLAMKVDGGRLRVDGQNKSDPQPSTFDLQPPTIILETPWLEETADAAALTRTLLIGSAKAALKMLVADPKARVRLHPRSESASVGAGHGGCHVLTIEPHDKPVTIKLLIASADVNEAAFDKLVAASPAPEDVLELTKPGPTIWGEPLVTKGEVAKGSAPYVVDTITLPFKNPFNALFFCGGHDFLPDGRAAVCTLHGDVWLVDGIDEKLERITWRRFATGLFQPLGLKILPPLAPLGRGAGGEGRTLPSLVSSDPAASNAASPTGRVPQSPLTPNPSPQRGEGNRSSIFVVGRDQITRLHDLNDDGEADYYENFNNDAHTTMNGHEYVTCLETDRAGNFYYVKGNCDSATPHDGSLLRVSADGSKLDVFATGFRNSNGIGMGPNDEITVAPQEGEWTPASGLFVVREGGFYGMMQSHHQATLPTDFIRPLCWFSRRDDNSCGGQVWTTSDRFGPLSNQLLHLSYGQCKLRLVLREAVDGRGVMIDGTPRNSIAQIYSLENRPFNGGSIELPLTFASGIHRGRMNPHDGQLYLTGLKGWVSSAVNDGCFQRVRYTGVDGRALKVEGQNRSSAPQPTTLNPQPFPIAMRTYRNGIALTFTGELDREAAEDTSSYQLEAWNYKWSSAYGSPDLKPSAPEQVGRDEIEPKSATLLEDNRTVFIELPGLKPVDQLAVGYTLLTHDGKALEQTVTLTLNAILDQSMPDEKLHRFQRPSLLTEAEIQELIPGVTCRVNDHGTNITYSWHHRRLLAWDFALPRLPGEPFLQSVVAQSFLKVPSTGEYRFRFEGDGKVALRVNDEKVQHDLSQDRWLSLRLRRGYNKLEIDHKESPAESRRGDYRFRLVWEGNAFPEEAVPSTLLFTRKAFPKTANAFVDAEPYRKMVPAYADDPSDARAAELSAKLACANCHSKWAVDLYNHRHDARWSLKGEPYLVAYWDLLWLRSEAPQLAGVTKRLNRDWLMQWLDNPKHLRADARMPRLLAKDDRQTAADLIAFLETLPETKDVINSPALDKKQNSSIAASVDGPEVTQQGMRFFESFGCIACHRHTPASAQDEWNRVPLDHVRHKYQRAGLQRFLLKPEATHTASRMPNFRLSNEETTALSAFLFERSNNTKREVVEPIVGSIERGRAAFKRLNCGNCHVSAAAEPLTATPINHSDRGCLAEKTPIGLPHYELSKAEREGLRNFHAFPKELIKWTVPPDQAVPDDVLIGRSPRSLMRYLRCQACHPQDSERSLWPEIVAEEGSGRAVDAVPQLTWVGEKLQGPWIEKLLKGEIKQKPRPWLTARMPSFPAYAGVIAHGMAAEHGVPFEEPLPKELDAEQIEIGRQLTLRDGGLDCRQCHGIGKEQPRGDASTQIALGINFALARERLRPEFALRQMLDPPRYDIGSRMPRFAPDLRTTAAKHIADGDARKQFEALKQFIWSVKPDE